MKRLVSTVAVAALSLGIVGSVPAMAQKTLLYLTDDVSLYDQSRPIGVDASYAVLLYFVSPKKGGLINMTNYLNERVDDLFYAQKVESDPTVRQGMLTELQNTRMDEILWIPVVEYKSQWAYADNMRGITLHPDSNTRWAELYMEE